MKRNNSNTDKPENPFALSIGDLMAGILFIFVKIMNKHTKTYNSVIIGTILEENFTILFTPQIIIINTNIQSISLISKGYFIFKHYLT